MQTEVMKMFGLKAPIFAFSHCRDVVAAVSRAGGLGALGTTRESVSELEVMLNWIDDHIDDEPYGVDVVFPSKAPKEFETMSAKEVIGLIPQTHWDFVEDVLREYGVPPHTKEEKEEAIETFIKEQFRTHAQAEARLDVVYQHPKARLIVSALGVPPNLDARPTRSRSPRNSRCCWPAPTRKRKPNTWRAAWSPIAFR